MRKIIFASLLFVFAFSLTISAQQATKHKLVPAPDSAEVQSAKAQALQYISNLKAGKANQAQSSDVDESSATSSPVNTPKFAIRPTGDSATGIYVVARSANIVPRNTIYFASKTDPSGNTILMRPYITDSDMPASWIWLDLENGKKSVWDEPSGTLTYQMFSFTNGRMSVATAEKEYMTGQTSPQFINKAEVVMQGGNPHFVLKGNFGNTVGVGTLKSVEGEYEVYVPTNAVRLVNSGKVDIDLSKIPDYYVGYGDFLVTVVNSAGLSNTVTVRYAPDANTSNVKDLS